MLRSTVFASCFSTLLLLLIGCALTNTASPVEERGLSLQGRVQGGQQPVVGAHVYLLAANTAGYPTASVGASKSLMKFVNGATSIDISSGPTNGFYYVTTDSTGSFAISNDYTCTSGQQVYLYIAGGDPGAGTNSAAAFLAVLGNCPSAGNFASTYPYIWVNEVTTVAAAYSMSAFAYDALHVSSPSSTLAKRNLANAFANAANIADISSGTAYATLPNGNGAGAPSTVNTVANILAACVNTNGPASNNCATLFTLAKTNGTSGTAATDTATAAINIAHNQGSSAAPLYDLLGTEQAFTPSYSTAPADFSMPIHFTSPEVGGVNGIAVDSLGDVWLSTSVDPSNATSVNGFSELSPAGAHLTTVTDASITSAPQHLMVSAEGNVFGDVGTKEIEYVPGGSVYSSTLPSSPFPLYDIAERNGFLDYLVDHVNVGYLNGADAPGTNDSGSGVLAVDGNGNFWATNRTSGTLSGWNSSGARITPSTSGYSIGTTPLGLAVDQNNNLWVGTSTTGNVGTGYITKLNGSGTTLATYTDASVYLAGNLYVDGANTIFGFVSSTSESFVQLDTNGNALQTFGRVAAFRQNNEHTVALDGSGNMWVPASGGVYQLVGIATPVVTPIAANLVSPYTAPASKP